jgi:hypothetical protein
MYESAELSLLCSETKSKIDVFCIKCKRFSERYWQGRIIGKGIHGSVNAIFTRVKQKYKLLRGHLPLIRLLTLCIKCSTELELYDEADQINWLFGFKDDNKTSRGMTLRISYKRVEEVVSSKVIVMEGVLMNTIKTVGVDGKYRKWYLWN